MPDDKPILEFEEDSLVGEVCYFADLPDKYYDGDYEYIENLNHYEARDALEETADYVDEDVFDGPSGMSGSYYKVYAQDSEDFKKKLTAQLLVLFEKMEDD